MVRRDLGPAVQFPPGLRGAPRCLQPARGRHHLRPCPGRHLLAVARRPNDYAAGPPYALGARRRILLAIDVFVNRPGAIFPAARPRPSHGRHLGRAGDPGGDQQHRFPLDAGRCCARRTHDPGGGLAHGRLRRHQHGGHVARRRTPAADHLPAQLPGALPDRFRRIDGQLVARQAHPRPRPRAGSQRAATADPRSGPGAALPPLRALSARGRARCNWRWA